MTYEEYLASKKIDARAFAAAEPALYRVWEADFNQMHPNSFTVQKLNLINPIRRKYHLKEEAPPASPANPVAPAASPSTGAPQAARPMMKPKPKIN